MAIMFNLDNLNENRLESMQHHGWEKGCIPESPDSFIELLVQRVNRGRFRFEMGNSSDRPHLLGTHERNGPGQTKAQGNLRGDTQLNSTGPNVRE